MLDGRDPFSSELLEEAGIDSADNGEQGPFPCPRRRPGDSLRESSRCFCWLYRENSAG